MLRRLVSVTFILAVGFVAGCGHQVTPSPTTNNLAGDMVVRFRTNGTMDFNNFNYVIVINTCGVGGQPYPNAYATTFNNYSYSFNLGASTGGATASPVLYQYLVSPGTSNVLNPQNVPLGPSTTQLVLNDNGQGNEFQLTFSRAQLDNPLQVSNPCPNGTPAPAGASAAPSTSPGASPSAGTLPTPSVVPSASPSPVPASSSPPLGTTEFWFINFFTIDKNRIVQDSLGQAGATDNSFVLQVDTFAAVTMPLTRPAGSLQPSNPAAAIAGGEVDNYL